MVRINKLLSNLGICSRKEAARYIEDGRIKINGVLSIPGQWVEEDDEIRNNIPTADNANNVENLYNITDMENGILNRIFE